MLRPRSHKLKGWLQLLSPSSGLAQAEATRSACGRENIFQGLNKCLMKKTGIYRVDIPWQMPHSFLSTQTAYSASLSTYLSAF